MCSQAFVKPDPDAPQPQTEDSKTSPQSRSQTTTPAPESVSSETKLDEDLMTLANVDTQIADYGENGSDNEPKAEIDDYGDVGGGSDVDDNVDDDVDDDADVSSLVKNYDSVVFPDAVLLQTTKTDHNYCKSADKRVIPKKTVPPDPLLNQTFTSFKTAKEALLQKTYNGFEAISEEDGLHFVRKYPSGSAKFTVVMKSDFTYDLFVHGFELPRTHNLLSDRTDKLDNESEIRSFLNDLNKQSVCIGNPDEKFQGHISYDGAPIGNWKGVREEFSALRGNITYKSTIRSVDCIYISEKRRCARCSKYRQALAIKYHLNVKQHKLDTEGADSVETFPCTGCDKVFLEKRRLEEHQTTHSSEKPFSCDKCKRTFKREKYLRMHRKRHEFDSYIYICATCGKQFKYESFLKRHEDLHNLEALFQCELCGRQFKLERHLMVHRKLDRCTKEKKKKLYVYRKRKRPQKPFVKCASCGKLLYRHVTNHICKRDGGFPCDVCGKLFKRGQDCRRHRLIHTSLRPYACSTCGRTFRQVAHLKDHERIHFGDHRHKCVLCKRKYTTLEKFKEHAKACQAAKIHNVTTKYVLE